MAFGLDITIPSDVDDPTLPYADDDDALMVPGSLLLIDPAHSAAPMGALPAQASFGQTGVPNIAYKHLADVVGSGDATSLACIFFFDSSVPADAVKFEKTAKGGIHGLISQVNNTAASQGAWIQGPTALNAYLLANKSHKFYMSRWSRTTRASLIGAGTRGAIYASNGSASADSLFLFRADGRRPLASAGNSLGNFISVPENALGIAFEAVGATGFGGVTPTSVKTLLATWGTTAPDNYGTPNNKEPSSIVYRIYLEDLTVSGRTFEEVRAADYALSQAAFAAGGRYAADTFTDPAAFA